MQQRPHKNKATFNDGRKSNDALKPATQTIPETILKLLSYISLPFSVHSFALNAMIHLPTNIVINELYNNEQIANTHTLYEMKQRYMPNRNPSIDSAPANHTNLFIATFLILSFHIIPIHRPAIDDAKLLNAIHCAGNSVIIALVIVGCAYVINNPEQNKLSNNQR